MSDSSKRGGGDTGNYSVEPTIVGGRPLGNGRPQRGIPHGIEVLVKKASVDPAFRELLLDKRAAAATEIGLELSAAEIATLNSVPHAQILQIINNTSVPDEHRRVFLGRIAAAMLALLGVGLLGCSGEGRGQDRRFYYGGIRPEDNPRIPMGSEHVSRKDERLKVEVVDQGENVVIAKVDYDCPFDHGELVITFAPDHGRKRGQLVCNPSLVIVNKGRDKAVFHAEGKGGTTEWIAVRLLNATESCRKEFRFPLIAGTFRVPFDFRPGEYLVDDCAIYRMERFHKVWPS